MAKNLGITCDEYKTEKFRERFKKEGFNIVIDKGISSLTDVHFFRIECSDEDFPKMVKKMEIVLKELEIEIKQSN